MAAGIEIVLGLGLIIVTVLVARLAFRRMVKTIETRSFSSTYSQDLGLIDDIAERETDKGYSCCISGCLSIPPILLGVGLIVQGVIRLF